MSCDAMRFGSGKLAFEVPTGELATELPADTEDPTVIPIQTADLTATATLSGKGDNRSNEGHSFFLDLLFEPPASVECNPVMASDEFSPSRRTSRNMSAQVNCKVTALNISPGSVVKENGVITRFTAEWTTKGEVDINHGERFGEVGWRGGRFEIEIRTVYEFVFEGTVVPPFTGCRVSPRTTHLPVHRPEFYLPEISEFVQFPDRSLNVTVLNDGQPVVGNQVSMSSSQSAFPVGGVLPSSSSTTATTDDTGKAEFPINPLANSAFDQTDFVASTMIGGVEHTCDATVVAGFGTPFAPYADKIGEVVDTMAFSRQVLDQVLAYLPETRSKIKRDKAYKELVDLLRREVLTQPDNYRRMRDRMRRHGPAIRAYLEGREMRPNKELMADFREVLRFLSASGGPEVRKATIAAARALPSLWLVAGDDGVPPRKAPPAESLQHVKAAFGKLPLSFEPNVGQTTPGIDFFSRGPGYGVYLTAGQALLVRATPGYGERSVVRLALEGANGKARTSAEKPLPGKSHYLLGNQPSGWHTDVPHAARVRYHEVYPGVDLIYYGNRRRLEFDFEVSPGGNPEQIRLSFPGTERVELDSDGHLLLATAAYSLTLERPVVYQESDGHRREIAGAYRLARDRSVGFHLGAYDPSLPLVIDPVLQYASYLGGIGEDTPTAIALDPAGNIYLAGTTASADFPIENPLQAGLGQGGFVLADAFVTKLDPTGKTLLYSTYLGGNSDDSAIGIAAYGDGLVALTGMTSSADFPTLQPIQATYANAGDMIGSDAFVTALASTGSALVYSTYLGGKGLDSGSSIAVDAAGNAAVAGSTTSTDLPVVNALQPNQGGGSILPADAMVAKLGPNGAAIFVTYLGGAGDDAANGVAIGPGGIYVAGSTFSADFPLANAFQDTNTGARDAFVTKINDAGQALVYSTYLGGSSDDIAMDIAVDDAGHAYITGSTGSGNFPLEGAVQDAPGDTNEAGLDAFVTQFTNDGTALAFSTYLGAGANDVGYGIAVGSDRSVYVAGETTSTDFPTEEAFQAGNAGASDGFVTKLAPIGVSIAYSTYIGGSMDDAAVGIAVDQAGNAWITGPTQSPDAPLTADAFQTTAAGDVEGFVAKLAPGVPLPAMANVSAASFSAEHGLALDSFAAGFGAGMADGSEVAAELPLPITLANAALRLTDNAGTEHWAKLFSVSPGQINWIVPGRAVPGLGTVEVFSDGQITATQTVRIVSVAPALFYADPSAPGVAAALWLKVAADGTQTQELIFDANTLEAVPLDLGGPNDQVILLLFGTGMRNFSQSATATVDGLAAGVAGPVAQSQFPGLDQINIGPLPRDLIGRGEVQIVVTVDGKVANVVTVTIN